MTIPLISYHGSHSGEFCSHAPPGTLEEIVAARIEKGFTHFGLTEHQYIGNEAFLYVEDQTAGKSVSDLRRIFSRYIKEARRLQQTYASRAVILVGFETEVYDATCFDFIQNLRKQFEPDYIVGSLHHVAGIAFDTSGTYYQSAIDASGGVKNLYQKYYDTQLELIRRCRPEVIGHFDIVKIFSGTETIHPDIWPLIERNIEAVIRYHGIFEVNTRSFMKGLASPYPGEQILQKIAEMGGDITLGDDSHSLKDIGYQYGLLENILPKYFNTVVALEKSGNHLTKKRLALTT